MSSRSLVIFCIAAVSWGCTASTQVTNTPRSTIEQRLLVRALERALRKHGSIAG